MRTFRVTIPADELKKLNSGVQQFINKPKGICSWQQGDRLILNGEKEVTVQFTSHTAAFVGKIPLEPITVKKVERVEF